MKLEIQKAEDMNRFEKKECVSCGNPKLLRAFDGEHTRCRQCRKKKTTDIIINRKASTARNNQVLKMKW